MTANRAACDGWGAPLPTALTFSLAMSYCLPPNSSRAGVKAVPPTAPEILGFSLDDVVRAQRSYEPLRQSLYTPDELHEGYAPGKPYTSLDDRIFFHVVRNGQLRGRRPQLQEAVAQRIHDFSIDAALARYLDF